MRRVTYSLLSLGFQRREYHHDAGRHDREAERNSCLKGQQKDSTRHRRVGQHGVNVALHAALAFRPSGPASSVSVGNSLSVPPITWITTWLAPARGCSRRRLAISSGVPWAIRAAMNLSLPGGVRSASVKPSRLKLFT